MDEYRTGDPIFEHGGESEREFAVLPWRDVTLLAWAEECAKLLRKFKGDYPSFLRETAMRSFQAARELERRRLNG